MNAELETGNRRIVKNSLFMYFRMFVLMVISLYTSRVVLQTLGVSDFGIYNVVGGVVVLFSFINNAMSTGTQRHLAYEIGKKDGNITKVFNAALHIHIVLAIIIAILAETIGLWFLNSQMSIPAERLASANYVYQFSVFCSVISIIRVPYDAAVIAWEKMNFYAYISILEGVLKLAIVFVIMTIAADKLVIYSFLHFVVVVTIACFFALFCHKNLEGIFYAKVNDSSEYKFLLSYSGWTLFGSSALVAETQGINILINIFYGVVLNASVGISNQVKGVIQQFVNSFQQALNPQLIKSHASGDKSRQYELICLSSKLAFFISFVIAIPLIFNIEFLLRMWLGEVPPYTAEITSLSIIVIIIDCLSSPLYTTIFAIGNIKYYQIVLSLMKLFGVIVAYILCVLEFNPQTLYYPPCLIAIALLWYRLFYVKRELNFNAYQYAKDVLFPVALTIVLTTVPFVIYKLSVNYTISLLIWITETFITCLYSIVIIYIVGLDKNEKNKLKSLILSKIKI